MNSEELEVSLRTEFENYLKDVFAGMRHDVQEFQSKIDAEFEKHRSQIDEAFRGFAARFDSENEFDQAFHESVLEHLRLARDEGARITANALAEAEKLEPAGPEPVNFAELRDAVAEISSKDSQSSILKSLIGEASKFAPRGAFFIIKNEHFVGWKVFGNTDEDAESAVREIHFPVASDTILGKAVDSRSTVEASYGENSQDESFLAPIEFGQPQRMYALPLVARGRGVAVMYADGGSDGGTVNAEVLEMLVRVAALTVEVLASPHPSQTEQVPQAAEYASQIEEYISEPALAAEPYFEPAKPHYGSAEDHFGSVEPAFDSAEPGFEPAESHFERAEPAFELAESHFESAEPAIEQPEPRFEAAVPAVEQPEPRFESAEPHYVSAVPGFDHAEPGLTSESPDVSERFPVSYDAGAVSYNLRDEAPAVDGYRTTEDLQRRIWKEEPYSVEQPTVETEPYHEADHTDDAYASVGSPFDTTANREPEAETETPPAYDPAPAQTEPSPQFETAGSPAMFDSSAAAEPAAGEKSMPFNKAVQPFGPAGAVVTQQPPAVSAPTRLSDRPVDLPVEVAEGERRLHNDARRFARLLVSEIKLYNEKKVLEGRQAYDLYDRLREAIDRSREMYDKRVQPPVAAKFDYFHYELVNGLAEGNAERLGSSYPGATV